MKKPGRWFYVGIGVVIMLLVGMVYAWSVFSVPIAAEFPAWTKAQLSMTFTIMMAVFCVGCMLCGCLIKRMEPRLLIWGSAALFLLGFYLSANMRSLAGLYIGFGAVCGFAAGVSYNAVMGSVSKWFPDKQGLVSGILLMGLGLSSFIIGKLFQLCTPDTVGAWRRSFVVLGVVIAAILAACGCFLKKPGADFQAPAAAEKKRRNPAAMEATAAQMLKQPAFWLYYIWAILLSSSGLALVSQASGIAREVGRNVPAARIASVAGLMSICNGIGRVIMGGMYDRFGRSVTMQTVNAMFIVTSIILTAALKTGSFALIVLGFILGGLAYGGVTPAHSAFISSYYGIKNYPVNFSVITTNLIVSSAGSTVAGALYDATQSYMSTYIMLCVAAALGIAVSFGISIADRRAIAKAASKAEPNR